MTPRRALFARNPAFCSDGFANRRRFRLAIPEATWSAGGTYVGGSTTGSWGTTTFNYSSYNRSATASNGASIVDSAPLSSLGLNGMKVGKRSSDGANVLVMQNGPLGVLIGARNSLAVGYMEIGAP